MSFGGNHLWWLGSISQSKLALLSTNQLAPLLLIWYPPGFNWHPWLTFFEQKFLCSVLPFSHFIRWKREVFGLYLTAGNPVHFAVLIEILNNIPYWFLLKIYKYTDIFNLLILYSKGILVSEVPTQHNMHGQWNSPPEHQRTTTYLSAYYARHTKVKNLPKWSCRRRLCYSGVDKEF